MKRIGLALAGLALALAACSGTGSGPTGSPASSDPNAIKISARNLVFSTDQLSAPADEPFKIEFDNQEGAPHNVAIYRDESASEKLFGEDVFSGPAVVTYNVPALPAGSYFFRCDLHPDMKGTLTTTAR